ncbi:hypothetical protein [Bradyrhizobium sp.]|jgi:hypothetical protein|uniref:hypothetical protein n=1 Tax=Bradyrhizobium sp. TaxID=376 RepID=UPI002E05B440|nr:hypothetical protein [Bradyrhizobium sp.]
MKIPEEFVQFVWGIYDEDPQESVSLESLAAAALAGTASHDRRRPLLAFLNELLDGGHSDAELEYVWRKQSPRSNFSPGGHRVFFEEIRRQIIADKDRKLG